MSDTAAAQGESAEPTVAETPEPMSSTPESEVQKEQDLDFLTEPEGELDADLPEEPAPEPEPTPVVEPKPEEPKTPEGVPAPLVEVEPPTAAEPVQPPVEPVAEPTVQAAPTPQLTQEQLVEQHNQWRKQAEELLATQRYAIDEQMAGDLDEDANAVIPRLMSKVYMDAVIASVGHVMSTLPQAVENVLRTRESDKANEDAFYSAWPQLKPGEHHDTIVRLGMAYRQIDPNASLETFVRNVGAQAMVALKISTETASVAPVAPPFQPVIGSPPVSGPAIKENPFTQLSREFDEEDADFR